MNNHDPVIEQYHAQLQYANTIHPRDSFITNLAALVLFLFIIVPLVLNLSYQEAAKGLLGVAYRMAARVSSRLLSYTPVGLQRSVGEGSALKSVFGLDSGLLRSGLDSLKGPKSNTPPGLGNMNNSCYQNSVIQGLASVRSFRDFLVNISSKDSTPSSINTALLDTIEDLNSSGNNGRQLWLPSALKTMSTWQQQDAQEYFSKVLDQVDKEVDREAKRRMSQTSGLQDLTFAEAAPQAKATVTSSSTEANPLEGLLAQRVGCTSCNYTDGLSMIPFNNLTVPLGDHSICDVRDCLDEYSKLEYIEGVQCPKCTLLLAQNKYNKMLVNNLPEPLASDVRKRLQVVEDALKDEDFSDATLIKKCNIPKKQWVSSTKSKQAVIGRAPKSFIIHVNRSIFNEYTGAQEKNNTPVRFPLFFNLDDWCLGKATDSVEPGAKVESWSMDPNESMLADPEKSNTSRPPSNYELRAVVTHFGRHENGHYICFRKAAYVQSDVDSLDGNELGEESQSQGDTKEAWWRLSDEDVSLVSEEYVLRQGGVFMLFYERIDGSAAPLQSFKQVGETCADLSGLAVLPEQAAKIPLPADSDDEFASSDEMTLEEKPPLPLRRVQTQQGPPSASTLSKQTDSANLTVGEESDTTSTHSTTNNDDLFQSTAAAAGFTSPLAGEAIRMRTSSAFATGGGSEDPLQSPIRMGTAF